MHNSESKFSAAFPAIQSDLTEITEQAFTVVFFAQEGNSDIAAAESVHQQTIRNWELLIVSPPSGSTTIKDGLCHKIGHDRLLGAELASLVEVISSRPTRYISFLDQDSTWHNQRLVHDYLLLEKSSAPAVASVPLILASDAGAAHVASPPLRPNSIVSGESYIRSLLETKVNFSPATVTVLKKAFLQFASTVDLTVTIPLLRLLVSTTLYYSDKCLTNLNYQLGAGGSGWADYARQLLDPAQGRSLACIPRGLRSLDEPSAATCGYFTTAPRLSTIAGNSPATEPPGGKIAQEQVDSEVPEELGNLEFVDRRRVTGWATVGN
jgi:hypothetical protein